MYFQYLEKNTNSPGIMKLLNGLLTAVWLLGTVTSVAADMQPISHFSIDRTEVTVGEYARFVEASGYVTKAERDGGGLVYESGWQRKAGWTWRTPFGSIAEKDEPAVHITYDDAQAYCKWAGKRLPTEKEWLEAAYTERRANPPSSLKEGQVYLYPTGSSPEGANCLEDCGQTSALDHSDLLNRGKGHALAGRSKAGVNGLFDMGANVWEWVDNNDDQRKGTLGGSWWYGSAQMKRDHRASKPREMAVVYIGFRCVRDNE